MRGNKNHMPGSFLSQGALWIRNIVMSNHEISKWNSHGQNGLVWDSPEKDGQCLVNQGLPRGDLDVAIHYHVVLWALGIVSCRFWDFGASWWKRNWKNEFSFRPSKMTVFIPKLIFLVHWLLVVTKNSFTPLRKAV